MNAPVAETDPGAAHRHICEQIKTATAEKRALHIQGAGSKRFLSMNALGETVAVQALTGIVTYEPTELVITVRAGTPLASIDAALAEHGQMLGFEPPQLSADTTIGGIIACGWSGPGRPYRGSARDFVLGVELINGHGQTLRFGGQVMKNVAGYDIARLAAGSYGALGVISEVSLRVIPRPQREATLSWQMPIGDAAGRMRELAREAWPISAMAASDETLFVRVSGSEEAVVDAIARLSPERLDDHDPRWARIRDLSLDAFTPPQNGALWRLSLPPAAPDPEFELLLIDWGGAQRWVHAPPDDSTLGDYCRRHGGHATCIDRTGKSTASAVAAPAPALQTLMLRIKQAFDPAGIFNPGYYFGWM